jgi:hypothetical protein
VKLSGHVRIWATLAGVAVLFAAAALGAALFAVQLRQDDIQDSRAENVLSACREQNGRHDASIAALDRILDKAGEGASPERLAQIRQSRTSTVLLIAALAPKRDCVQRTLRLVGKLPDRD